MTWWGWLLVTAAVPWLLDRLLIWCELRGWIYYRLSPRPVRQSLGNMMMSVEEFYRPTKKHAIELLADGAVQRQHDEDGAGPDPGFEALISAGSTPDELATISSHEPQPSAASDSTVPATWPESRNRDHGKGGVS